MKPIKGIFKGSTLSKNVRTIGYLVSKKPGSHGYSYLIGFNHHVEIGWLWHNPPFRVEVPTPRLFDKYWFMENGDMFIPADGGKVIVKRTEG